MGAESGLRQEQRSDVKAHQRQAVDMFSTAGRCLCLVPLLISWRVVDTAFSFWIRPNSLRRPGAATGALRAVESYVPDAWTSNQSRVQARVPDGQSGVTVRGDESRAAPDVLGVLLGSKGRGPFSLEDIRTLLSHELDLWRNSPKAATAVLNPLANKGLWDVSEKILLVMREGRVEINVFHASCVVSACEKGGQWQLALSYLRKLPQFALSPDRIVYNAAISACKKGGQWQLSLILLKEMPLLALFPNEISYNSAMSSCAQGAQWEVALALLREMPVTRVCINEVSCNAAITACEKGSQWQLALSLLGEMPGATLSPDLFSYSSAISACEKGGQWPFALHLLREMPQSRVRPNEISYNAAISACEKGAEWTLALELLSEMLQSTELHPDTISYNAAISACEKGGQWQAALQLMSDLARVRLMPDIITYNSAISACEKGGEWPRALTLLCELTHARLRPDTISYNAAINACKRGGQWQRALSLFREMPHSKVPANEFSYLAAIGACDRGGQWQRALGLLAEMSKKGVAPHESSYNAAISACEESGQWQQALAVMSSMQQAQLKPGGISWGSLLSAMGRGASSEDAMHALMLDLRGTWASSSPARLGIEGALRQLAVEAGDSSVQILQEAPGVLALSKPAGMTSEHALELVSNRLLRAGCASELSLVSRLDVPTSGVMPVALGGAMSGATQWLQAQFAARQVAKEYLCLCFGKSLGLKGTEGVIDSPLLTSRFWHGQKGPRVICSSLGKEAKTLYQVLNVFDLPETSSLVDIPPDAERRVVTLLLARPLTGRTHQIRAHLASIGRPVLGDEAYGGALDVRWCPRLFLHCRSVLLTDLQGAPFKPEASLPQELLQVLSQLGAKD
ncbi:unnamed protein product, partial [Polarella glacialis]